MIVFRKRPYCPDVADTPGRGDPGQARSVAVQHHGAINDEFPRLDQARVMFRRQLATSRHERRRKPRRRQRGRYAGPLRERFLLLDAAASRGRSHRRLGRDRPRPSGGRDREPTSQRRPSAVATPTGADGVAAGLGLRPGVAGCTSALACADRQRTVRERGDCGRLAQFGC